MDEIQSKIAALVTEKEPNLANMRPAEEGVSANVYKKFTAMANKAGIKDAQFFVMSSSKVEWLVKPSLYDAKTHQNYRNIIVLNENLLDRLSEREQVALLAYQIVYCANANLALLNNVAMVGLPLGGGIAMIQMENEAAKERGEDQMINRRGFLHKTADFAIGAAGGAFLQRLISFEESIARKAASLCEDPQALAKVGELYKLPGISSQINR